MTTHEATTDVLDGLNQEQREAVCHGDGPLLVIAGAGTGKTRALVHRVAHLIDRGIDPRRILLLTFTRRAAGEMLRRVDALLRKLGRSAGAGKRTRRAAGKKVWGGTFHAVATRLLRTHGRAIGLDPGFVIHDRSDSEDLVNVVRTELDLTKTDKRFPKKRTCMAIYSHSVNSRRPLEKVLADHYPWCKDYADDLKRLFRAYVDRKETSSVLDYDDLLLFWLGLLEDEKAGAKVRDRFDCVLVDEYQDTNYLQADILRRLRPDGAGLTVVGDDAQSIYSFRAATVRNILDFPEQFPGTTVVTLRQNYRSTEPILDATNAVIARARERYTKDLWTTRAAGDRPALVYCEDEGEQADILIRRILQHREEGIDLRRQAVLFRASHHSMVLETELAAHNIPFVKYGGLKFVEAAHVKDLMAILRLAENPKDVVAGVRVLMLLPGIGPKKARQLMMVLLEASGDFQIWKEARVPAPSRAVWPKLVRLMRRLAGAADGEVPPQVHAARKFYAPLLEEKYDNVQPRLRDLEQLEQMSGRFPKRGAMLAEIALDPPQNTEDMAGPPLVDEDYLILSTIHSAKGLEWDAVYVIHAADGNIPSDMSTGSREQIEEELRLFYVALTRAKSWLYVCFPQRYFHGYRGPRSDQYGYAQLTRFLPKSVQRRFESRVGQIDREEEELVPPVPLSRRRRIRRRVRGMWL